MRNQTYITGLQNADLKGFQAGERGDPVNGCPYQRAEHRECWHNGYMRGKRLRNWKPLSPRRARELRDRAMKKRYGDRKQRTQYFERMIGMILHDA